MSHTADTGCPCLPCEAARLVHRMTPMLDDRMQAYGDELTQAIGRVADHPGVPPENAANIREIDATIADLRTSYMTVVVAAILGGSDAAATGTDLVEKLTNKIVEHAKDLARVARVTETMQWVHDDEETNGG